MRGPVLRARVSGGALTVEVGAAEGEPAAPSPATVVPYRRHRGRASPFRCERPSRSRSRSAIERTAVHFDEGTHAQIPRKETRTLLFGCDRAD